MTVAVSRRTTPFRQYRPLAGSLNGRFTKIAERDAWIGALDEPTKDVQCIAAFGAAEGTISMAATDQTRRGIDPCRTVTEFAELVISRTPPPT